jgi:hypothetical protein
MIICPNDTDITSSVFDNTLGPGGYSLINVETPELAPANILDASNMHVLALTISFLVVLM